MTKNEKNQSNYNNIFFIHKFLSTVCIKLVIGYAATDFPLGKSVAK